MQNISLVVIGKDDLNNLKRIYSETYLSHLKSIFNELIYVDSLSEDSSIDFMKLIGFKVFQLGKDSFKSASAGRWAGAQEAKSKYILFLDSDMELIGANSLMSEVDAIAEQGFSGLVGDVTDIYPSGKKRLRIRKKQKDNSAVSFGGFLLIDRELLILSGNWNPFVPANEELELHSRLNKYNIKIYKTNKVSVLHYTVASSALNELLSLYFPIRKSRYGAYGYALSSAYRKGSLYELFNLSPEPLYFTIASLFIIIFLALGNYENSLLILLIYILLVWMKRSIKYLIVPPGIVISMWYGIFQYKEGDVNYEKK